MQMENANGDPPESPINGLRCFNGSNANLMNFSGCDGKHLLENSESFYKKLSEFYESSGLNLVLNVRETLLNLHVFFKEVTQRGGYYQVTKNKRWEEVAVALKLEGLKMKYPYQLQQVYALFLFQFEQIYFYRAPEKKAADPGHVFYRGNSPAMKRKSTDVSYLVSTDEEDVQVEKKILKQKSHQVFTGGTAEQKLSPRTPSKAKEPKKVPGRPPRIRTAYQIFIREECDRLKRIKGEKLRGQSFRSMADDAWRHLSDSERQPYIDESNKEKAKYSQELAASDEHDDIEDTEKEHNPLPHGDYSVQPDIEKPQVCNQSALDLANQTMKRPPADPVLQND